MLGLDEVSEYEMYNNISWLIQLEKEPINSSMNYALTLTVARTEQTHEEHIQYLISSDVLIDRPHIMINLYR